MKGMRLYLIGSGVALVLYLVAQYYKPKPTDWTPTYHKEDKIPFGMYILHQRLTDVFPDANITTSRLPVYNTLKDKELKHTNYLLIAGGLTFDELDYKELVTFLEQGNHAFIAAFSLGKLLEDTLKLRINTQYNYTKDKSIAINFVTPSLKADKAYIFDKGIGDQYFSKIDSSRATVLGTNKNGNINFVKYNFGKGALYILPSAQLLSNYNLLRPSGVSYAEKALSYLPVAEGLIWDEHYTKGNTNEGSAFRVIFGHESLRLAYYLSIAGLLIFVLFEMKRRQRIIPVITPLRNSSVDFVKVVGRVYYQQRDNRDIAFKKINYLLEHIRSTYRLQTTKMDKEFLNTLILKSGGTAENIRQLFATIDNIHQTQVISDEQLILLNKLIENFHKQAQ